MSSHVAAVNVLLVIACASAIPLRAQTPVSRDSAVAAAVTSGGRLAIARADTLVAFAGLVGARAWPNPTLNASYSKSPPTNHFIMDIPFEWPGQRGARIGAARATRLAAQYRFAFERAGAALDADTTYTRAVAARERAALSRHNAQEADSLRRMVAVRRGEGDASEMDVQLATVTAGQAANTAAADSLAYISAVLDLQTVMGMAADRVEIEPSDSLTAPPESLLARSDSGLTPRNAPPLQIAAAQASVEAARLSLRSQHRNIFSAPSLSAGIESGDPDHPGLLPTFGIALPLPLFDRNRGGVMQARAEQARAQAELTQATVQSHIEIARAKRELAIALGTVERDRLLITAATRVAAMSLTAYREGAASLPNVLEAQRSAREVLAQYIDDLANAWIFAAELRVISLAPSDVP
ncbi:MAG TPA: TolC family protein [Gemmatimonadaceae bacterium]|nr:TolC family protein [Gemmatimonadaceae bacterium]